MRTVLKQRDMYVLSAYRFYVFIRKESEALKEQKMSKTALMVRQMTRIVGQR